MAKLISQCPVCGEELKITKLNCSSCGLELSNAFELSIFDRLTSEQLNFMLTFLKHRGNLKSLQEEMKISYPYATKKLNDLLFALGLSKEDTVQAEEPEITTDYSGNMSNSKVSDIIRNKLAENGGRVTVSSISGNHYVVKAGADGHHFFCDELPPIYTYDVFDVIVELLKSQHNFKAKKGNARNYKLGDSGCPENSVAGTILKNYFGKNIGESGLDPVFVLAAVLEWAGIAVNGRGYLELTAAYRNHL